MKKMLITGSTGMLGSAIVKKALKKGYKVNCLVRPGSKNLKRLSGLDVAITECEMGKYASLSFDDDYDLFMHLAWDKTVGGDRDNIAIQMDNINYTLDAVQLASRSGCKVFVGAGSQAEYGIKDQPLRAETSINPESGYGIAKYSAGRLASLMCSQIDLRFNWIRVLSVYGLNDRKDSLVSYVISELRQGKSPMLTNCDQMWDYLFSDDAADAFIAVAEKGRNQSVYVLGSGTGKSLKDYIEIIKKIVNNKVIIEYGLKEYYQHQPMFLVADITDIMRDTGWKPKVSFEEGIRRIYEQD